ncbi:flagellar protein FliT [Paenibacillus sp. N1-5-1-14]|uniref:flagellar protein FliT n=1 Tax=Paenibacillus radicibacter TaxID=2972488 RepID=UPI002158A550|nr:flagellar protein FliT [Paenibacillus radicibacter]MCR8645033.1 flagellar protein FliT [Paenibacillus radicibacter]
MDSWITQLEELTEDMLTRLQFADSDDLEEFIESRDHIVVQLNGYDQDPTSQQCERVLKVQSYDVLIATRMEQLRLEASQGISKMDTARMQRNMYESSFDQESVFFDKRK